MSCVGASAACADDVTAEAQQDGCTDGPAFIGSLPPRSVGERDRFGEQLSFDRADVKTKSAIGSVSSRRAGSVWPLDLEPGARSSRPRGRIGARRDPAEQDPEPGKTAPEASRRRGHIAAIHVPAARPARPARALAVRRAGRATPATSARRTRGRRRIDARREDELGSSRFAAGMTRSGASTWKVHLDARHEGYRVAFKIDPEDEDPEASGAELAEKVLRAYAGSGCWPSSSPRRRCVGCRRPQLSLRVTADQTDLAGVKATASRRLACGSPVLTDSLLTPTTRSGDGPVMTGWRRCALASRAPLQTRPRWFAGADRADRPRASKLRDRVRGVRRASRAIRARERDELPAHRNVRYPSGASPRPNATNLAPAARFVTKPTRSRPEQERLGPAWPSERRARLGRQPLTRP